MSNSIEDIPYCDVFHPTMEEFENFSEYMEKITKLAKSGIFKVISNFRNFRLSPQNHGKRGRIIIRS